MYIDRVNTAFAGGASLLALARSTFGDDCTYKELHEDDKRDIIELRTDSMRWKIDRSTRAVYSPKCLRTVRGLKNESSAEARIPCALCMSLMELHEFQTALNRKGCRDRKNMKYTNIQYINMGMVDLYHEMKGLKGIIEPVSPIILWSLKPTRLHDEFNRGWIKRMSSGHYFDMPLPWLTAELRTQTHSSCSWG